jgi:hypothetical protein
MVEEASLEETGSGLAPATDGWFVVNLADAHWLRHDAFGAICRIEGEETAFPHLGVNVRVLGPGQPNCMELAQRHAAGVEVETTDPEEAYPRYPRSRPERLPAMGLPWQ